MKHISRREFSALVAGGVVAGVATGRFAMGEILNATPIPGQPAVTADQVFDRIRQNIGVEWRAETVDTLKAGDPRTTITGVVTTSLATMDVLQQAVAARANLIITSGTTFFGRADTRTPAVAGRGGGAGQGGAPAGAAAPPAAPPPPPNPILEAKNRFIDSNGLVVFRLSDHWRARTPDAFAQGLAERIFGEGAYNIAEGANYFDIPAIPLSVLASDVKHRLGGRGGIRVIGDPGTRIRKVAFLPGTTAVPAALAALPDVDLIIAGEVREWESAEYARDVVFSGQQKGVVLVGRILSEDPGMALCAKWLGDLVPEVSVRHISAGDPYWRPES